jgi:hypothetical protein
MTQPKPSRNRANCASNALARNQSAWLLLVGSLGLPPLRGLELLLRLADCTLDNNGDIQKWDNYTARNAWGIARILSLLLPVDFLGGKLCLFLGAADYGKRSTQ